MASTEHDKKLRAEFAAELGFYPATLDPEDIERHRALNRGAAKTLTPEQVERKRRHLREPAEQAANERAQRAEVADLYE